MLVSLATFSIIIDSYSSEIAVNILISITYIIYTFNIENIFLYLHIEIFIYLHIYTCTYTHMSFGKVRTRSILNEATDTHP